MELTDTPATKTAQPLDNSKSANPSLTATTTSSYLPQDEATQDDPVIPRLRLYLITLALGIANLMVSLNTASLGPALPAITSDFHTIDHMGWYNSAYLLPLMAFQLIFGKVVSHVAPKPFILGSIGSFGLSSILCATAPTSPVFVLARALSGLAAAGMAAGTLGILSASGVPMRERPRLLALIAAVQAVAYTTGPTLSGALTDSYLTWRFNFWINLPMAAIAVALVFFVIPGSSTMEPLKLGDMLALLDVGGGTLLVGCLVLLFLGLEWGGNSLPYQSPQVWGCFLGSGLFAIGFAAWEAVRKDKSVIPLRLLTQRTVAICCIFSLFHHLSNQVHVVLLPTYLQTVHSLSATLSGVYQLVMTASNLAAMLFSAHFISKTGAYRPFLLVSAPLYLIGAVLLQQMRASSPRAWYIGSLVPVGVGFGLGVHASVLAAQGAAEPKDIALACLLEIFCGQLGRSVGISIAQNIYVGELRRGFGTIIGEERAAGLAEKGLEGLVAALGDVDGAKRESFREVLNSAVTKSFIVPVAATAVASVVAWGIERKKLNVEKKKEEVAAT